MSMKSILAIALFALVGGQSTAQSTSPIDAMFATDLGETRGALLIRDGRVVSI